MTMATDFVTWLSKEMEDRGWNNSELARRAGLVPSAVSQVIAGNRGTGPEFCRSVARAFNLPAELVFRKAGLLPPLPGPEDDITFGELLDVVRNLSVEERVLVLEFAEFLHHGRRTKGGAGGPQTRPANTGATSTK
jgi:transcriptional regulator with XRE-family HTH domain